MLTESNLFYTIALPFPSGRTLHFTKEHGHFAMVDSPQKATQFKTEFDAEDYLFNLRTHVPDQHRSIAKALVVMSHGL